MLLIQIGPLFFFFLGKRIHEPNDSFGYLLLQLVVALIISFRLLHKRVSIADSNSALDFDARNMNSTNISYEP
ncbi:hypothetical protein EUGRSUZ_K03063 [Eucalyptus grandis]|uniref:Uncharacterized protein n=2 Tax=Eucalyptus grandis TaxID=71139 RepID=A0ACC3IZY0_EUCGR|nr:hypothetical protein EUGRSUZ_K03063 [Eucalyptus grandis]